jgi:hypothetical protein
MAEGVTGEALKRLPKSPCPPYWKIEFQLFSYDPDADWTFIRTSGCWRRDADRVGVANFVRRVVAKFRGGFFTAAMPAEMLSYHRLICGKGLTDPVSMARWIGPECWGSASTNIPHIFKAEDGGNGEPPVPIGSEQLELPLEIATAE